VLKGRRPDTGMRLPSAESCRPPRGRSRRSSSVISTVIVKLCRWTRLHVGRPSGRPGEGRPAPTRPHRCRSDRTPATHLGLDASPETTHADERARGSSPPLVRHHDGGAGPPYGDDTAIRGDARIGDDGGHDLLYCHDLRRSAGVCVGVLRGSTVIQASWPLVVSTDACGASPAMRYGSQP